MKNLFKKETPIDKIMTEIQSVEFKKVSANNVRESQKSVEKAKGDAFLFEAGLCAYKHSKGESCDTSSEDCFSNYEKTLDAMKEIDANTDSIIERYDQEINMLYSNLNMMQQSQTQQNFAQPQTQQNFDANPQVQSAGFCENCGNGLTSGDTFCQGCGNKVV